MMAETFPRQIYLLSPQDLSPETIAVTFAKTSRSPLSFREIAAELTDEESAQFHEKWVVGYGHASVAEHAVLHLAFENVSRLAVECIESNRLASYTEKSTRYQKWAANGFYVPNEVSGGSMEAIYLRSCNLLFKAYQDSLEPVRKTVQQHFPRRERESATQWENRIRSKYVDACRFLLPAASLANVGMTINARALEKCICKMLSHPLNEVREVGIAVKEVAQRDVPTLVKYANHSPYLIETQMDLTEYASTMSSQGEGDYLCLTTYDPDAEINVLAAAVYGHAGCSFDTALFHVRKIDETGRRDLAETLLGKLGSHDVPSRVLEHATYTFDVKLDQGAYFELKRHRMMTQTPQPLTVALGYAVPHLITDSFYEKVYRNVMDEIADSYLTLAEWNPYVASYIVPNGYNRRVLLTLNLREIYHLCELRSKPNAHFSMRRVALRMAELVREVHPLLAGFLRLPEGVNWHDVERENFTQV